MSIPQRAGASAPLIRALIGFATGVATVLSLSAALGAAETPEVEPRNAASLEDFVILEYVAAGAYPPGAIIAMDNNARILFECRNGQSVEELRSTGIEFVDSQLEFLIATKLLFRDGLGNLYTAFPVLDPASAGSLRAEASALAETLSETVTADVETLARALDASGYGGHTYSVLFSYVLDGMVWGFFEEYGRVPPRALSARRPFWAGEVWALRPEREFWARTRSIASGDLTLKVTSGSAHDAAEGLFADARRLKRAVAQFSTAGRALPEAERELPSEFGLLDESGRWAIPVINEAKKDSVFRAAETLTSNLVDAVLEELDLEGFKGRYRFRSSEQALVIVYHELMWELIDRFESMGLIVRPESLERSVPASRAEPATIGSAAFLVDRRKPRPNRQDVVEPRRDVSKEMEPEREPGGGE